MKYYRTSARCWGLMPSSWHPYDRWIEGWQMSEVNTTLVIFHFIRLFYLCYWYVVFTWLAWLNFVSFVPFHSLFLCLLSVLIWVLWRDFYSVGDTRAATDRQRRVKDDKLVVTSRKAKSDPTHTLSQQRKKSKENKAYLLGRIHRKQAVHQACLTGSCEEKGRNMGKKQDEDIKWEDNTTQVKYNLTTNLTMKLK